MALCMGVVLTEQRKYLDLEALLLKASLCDEAEDRRDREVVRYLLFGSPAEAGAHGRLDCRGGMTFLIECGHRELMLAGALTFPPKAPVIAKPLLDTVS